MQDLKRTMRPFGRSCSFVSGNTLAASTIPKGTTAASGSSFPSLSEPPQSTQTLGKCTVHPFSYLYRAAQSLDGICPV